MPKKTRDIEAEIHALLDRLSDLKSDMEDMRKAIDKECPEFEIGEDAYAICIYAASACNDLAIGLIAINRWAERAKLLESRMAANRVA